MIICMNEDYKRLLDSMKKFEDKNCSKCGVLLKAFQVPSLFGSAPRLFPPPDICDACQTQIENARKKMEDQRRIEEAFRSSMITPRFKTRTFSNFKVNELNRKAWEAAINFKIEPNGIGLLFFGSYGIGKTHLVAAIVNKLIGKINILYISCPDLLNEIREMIHSKQSSYRLGIAKTVDLLVLDDIGAEKPSEWVRETLFVLINYRYEHLLPTIFTTNYSLDELEYRLGGRISSRIAEMSRCIRFENKDWRTNLKNICEAA